MRGFPNTCITGIPAPVQLQHWTLKHRDLNIKMNMFMCGVLSVDKYSTQHELKLTIGPHGHTSHDVLSPSLTLDTERIVLESVLQDSLS